MGGGHICNTLNNEDKIWKEKKIIELTLEDWLRVKIINI